jgi:hypothetical protein
LGLVEHSASFEPRAENALQSSVTQKIHALILMRTSVALEEQRLDTHRSIQPVWASGPVHDCVGLDEIRTGPYDPIFQCPPVAMRLLIPVLFFLSLLVHLTLCISSLNYVQRSISQGQAVHSRNSRGRRGIGQAQHSTQKRSRSEPQGKTASRRCYGGQGQMDRH